MAADSEISLLTAGSILSKATRKTWSPQPAEEEEEQPHVKFLSPESGIASPQLRRAESKPASIGEDTSEDATQARLSLSFDTSQISVRSTDTTLEYYDAPQSEEQDGEEGRAATGEDEEVVTLNVGSLPESSEQPPELTPENRDEEHEALEDVMESGAEQEAKSEEDVQSDEDEDQDFKSSSKQEFAAPLEKEELPRRSQGKSRAPQQHSDPSSLLL